MGPARAPAAGAVLGVEVVAGRRAVLAELPRLERLAAELELPAPARTAWIRAQLDVDPGARPWALRVLDAGGALVAGAVVLDEGAGTVRLAGGGSGHRGALAARDREAAGALGRGFAAELVRRGVLPLPAVLCDDATTVAFAAAAGADRLPTPAVPALVPERGPGLAPHLSHGMLRTLRKARNRLDADGRRSEIVVTHRDEEIVAALPDLERLYRLRDERHGLASDLDTAEGLTAWRARIRRILDDRRLELAVLTVDGVLAAYVLGIRDGRWYRVLDGRMDGALARYAPGRLLEAAVVERALAAGHAGIDWMTAVAPETLLAATTVQPVVTLTWGPAAAGA